MRFVRFNRTYLFLNRLFCSVENRLNRLKLVKCKKYLLSIKNINCFFYIFRNLVLLQKMTEKGDIKNSKSATKRQSVANANPMAYNVEAIALMEREALHERSLGERISDAITGLIGSLAFVIFHLLLFTCWGIINLNLIPGVAAFDPFPFGILTLIVSAEGVFITIFILIGQNRMSRQSDRRAHLDLQVSILAEQELTMMLKMQQKLCEHFGVDVTSVENEAEQLMSETDVRHLVGELDEKLP